MRNTDVIRSIYTFTVWCRHISTHFSKYFSENSHFRNGCQAGSVTLSNSCSFIIPRNKHFRFWSESEENIFFGFVSKEEENAHYTEGLSVVSAVCQNVFFSTGRRITISLWMTWRRKGRRGPFPTPAGPLWRPSSSIQRSWRILTGSALSNQPPSRYEPKPPTCPKEWQHFWYNHSYSCLKYYIVDIVVVNIVQLYFDEYGTGYFKVCKCNKSQTSHGTTSWFSNPFTTHTHTHTFRLKHSVINLHSHFHTLHSHIIDGCCMTLKSSRWLGYSFIWSLLWDTLLVADESCVERVGCVLCSII